MGKIVVANWKMNKGGQDGLSFLESFIEQPFAKNIDPSNILIICPPYTLLREASSLVQEIPSIKIGSQDCAAFFNGAYTGDVSAQMVKDSGAAYVIMGHSERRLFHQETPALIHQKIQLVLESDLQPILCVGENKDQYEAKQTFKILEQDLTTCCQSSKVPFIAYEPLWAIGTGLTPTAEEVNEIHRFIKKTVKGITGAVPKVLYGGSVNPQNIEQFLQCPGVDGVLVGGASLELGSFTKLVEVAARI